MEGVQETVLRVLGPVGLTMVYIFFAQLGVLAVLWMLQRPSANRTGFEHPTNATKRAVERWHLFYSVVWIGAFAWIIAGKLYEDFDEWGYMFVCAGLDLPLLLQPIVWPLAGDRSRPILDRYATKTVAWTAIFGFIGNHFYTHYFFSVLKAEYTFPSWRLNNVPLALTFACQMFFSHYHVLSNYVLRKVERDFAAGPMRNVFKWGTICVFAYFIAFMETLAISGFPYYSFENRDMAYTIGSAFYGIYFIVSFPMHLRIEEDTKEAHTWTFWRTCVDSFGAGMIVLCLLDFVRLYLGIPLTFEIGPSWW